MTTAECPIIVDDLDEDDDDGVCPSPDVNTAVTNPASPPAEAPAAAGHIHDIFAEYEIRFGSDSSTRKSGQRKGSSPSSLHGTKPGGGMSLSHSVPKARDRLLLSTNRKTLTVPSLHSPGMVVLMPAMPPILSATAMNLPRGWKTAADSRIRHP